MGLTSLIGIPARGNFQLDSTLYTANNSKRSSSDLSLVCESTDWSIATSTHDSREELMNLKVHHFTSLPHLSQSYIELPHSSRSHRTAAPPHPLAS